MANVGDSRLLCIHENGECLQITEDHKPNNAVEKERILRYGGEIYRNSFKTVDSSHNILGPWRVLPGKLAVSRSIGDYLIKKAKKGVVSAEPDIF